MKKIFFSSFFILSSILIIGAFLRLYQLSTLPAGFQDDEASFFYNAIAIAKTGKDEDGRTLPLLLHSFIDPKPALFSYLQIPSYWVFGNSILAARIPSVVLGILSLLCIYLFFKELTNKNFALLITFLMAISPWHIMNSRATQEVMMSFTFGMAALLFLVYTVKYKNHQVVNGIAFAIFSILASYSYHAVCFLLPILIFIILFYYRITEKTELKKLIVIFTFSLVCFISVTFLVGFTRFNEVSIFNDQNTQLLLNERIRTATADSPYIINRLFNNKITAYMFTLSTNYYDYFTPSFLFLSGGQPQRYQIPYFGLLYPFEIFLLLLGVFQGLFNKNYKTASVLFLFWWIFSPIPAVVTSQEVPSTIRTFFMIIPLMYFIGVGITTLWSYKNPVLNFDFRILILLGYSIGFSYFLFEFNVQEPNFHPWYRNNADNVMVSEVNAISKNYRNIYIGGNEYIYFALAGIIPLNDLQNSYPKRIQETAKFGKYTFYKDACPLPPTHQLTNSPTHQLTNSPTHQLTNSPTHQLTNSPTHQLTNSPTHQLTNSPTHQLTNSPTHQLRIA